LRSALSSPIGAAVAGLFCCALALSPLVAAEDEKVKVADTFRVLKLEGHEVRWQPPAKGGPRVVTYRLVTETMAVPTARNCRGLTSLDGLAAASGVAMADLRAEVAAAFAMWETAANIVFKEAAEGATADILIGAQTEPDGWAFADVFFDASSSEAVKPISRALVCFNPAKRWKVGFDGDLKRYDLRYTLAHEIGHAIGLDHPLGANQIMHFRYEERFRALQPGDIRGAAVLYGPAPDIQFAGMPKPGAPATAMSGVSAPADVPGPTESRALGR
jgi:hypothetical protein